MTHASTVATRTNWSEGRSVVRAPCELRPHPALKEIGWTGCEEVSEADQLHSGSTIQPVLITTTGIVLKGFGLIRLAILEGKNEVSCIEYPLSDDESLAFMIAQHRAGQGWNDFIRIRLALVRKPDLRKRAVENMRAGGKFKGSAILPEAHELDVRREIASIAGTGIVNITKVERILQRAHPSIIAALQNDVLSIHRAWQWCKLPMAKQIEAFARFEEDRTRRRILRDISPRSDPLSPDLASVIQALQGEQVRQPERIRITTSRRVQTEIRVGRSLLQTLNDTRG